MDIEKECEKVVRVVKYTCEALWWYKQEKGFASCGFRVGHSSLLAGAENRAVVVFVVVLRSERSPHSALSHHLLLIRADATPILLQIRRSAIPHRHSQSSAVRARFRVPRTTRVGRERSVPTRTATATMGDPPSAAAGSPASNQPGGRHAVGSDEVPSSWSHREASRARPRVRSTYGEGSGGHSIPNCRRRRRRLDRRRVASSRTTCGSRTSCRRRMSTSRQFGSASVARMPAAAAAAAVDIESRRRTSARP